ncbi:MAG: DUF2334 domain-containing protein [archaeon]
MLHPTGGLNLLVNLGILFHFNLLKWGKMKPLLIPILIVIIILGLIIFTINAMAHNLISDRIIPNNCKVEYHETSQRNIVLRIDDIQAHVWSDIQMRMIQDALTRDKTVSLSVIPIGLHKDKEIVKFLREHRCELEIGLHGYDNSFEEFVDLSYEDADKKIKKGLGELHKIEKEVITFIPPNNFLSDGTREALEANGFKAISAGHGESEFDFTQSTFDWTTREFVDHKKVLSDCKETLDKGETCIIMIHPQDYVTEGGLDIYKYSNYLALLNSLDKLDATVVTFRDLVKAGEAQELHGKLLKDKFSFYTILSG